MASARDIAVKVLLKVEREQAFAAAVLAAETKVLNDDREVALAFELVLGCLRRQSWLDYLLASVAQKGLKKIDPEVLQILRVGAYQIAFLSKIPVSAAVNEAVNACRKSHAPGLSGLVNALLRKLSGLPQETLVSPEADDDAEIEILALRCGLPSWLLDEFVNRFGRQGAIKIATVFNAPSRRTLRINTNKISRDRVLAEFAVDAKLGELSSWAVDIESVKKADELVEKGFASYQDEAAQLAVLALDPSPGMKILDACAGRGGKTAAIAALTNNTSHLFAVDRSASKLARLLFELSKQDLSAHTEACDLTVSLPTNGAPFDRILVDAPCSGSGTLGRRPEIRKRLNKASITELVSIQKSILHNTAKLLSPGGRLVFVVCSLLYSEGFEHVKSFLSAFPEMSLVKEPPPKWPETISWNMGQIVIDPSCFSTDGYQILVFKKRISNKIQPL